MSPEGEQQALINAASAASAVAVNYMRSRPIETNMSTVQCSLQSVVPLIVYVRLGSICLACSLNYFVHALSYSPYMLMATRGLQLLSFNVQLI